MAFREVRAYEVREVLRLHLRGQSVCAIQRKAQLDRKTVRRYLARPKPSAWSLTEGKTKLTDEFVGRVVEAVRPHRTDGHGETRRILAAHRDRVAAWVDKDLSTVKIHELLERQGVVVPLRTVQRYIAQVCERTRGPKWWIVPAAESSSLPAHGPARRPSLAAPLAGVGPRRIARYALGLAASEPSRTPRSVAAWRQPIVLAAERASHASPDALPRFRSALVADA